MSSGTLTWKVKSGASRYLEIADQTFTTKDDYTHLDAVLIETLNGQSTSFHVSIDLRSTTEVDFGEVYHGTGTFEGNLYTVFFYPPWDPNARNVSFALRIHKDDPEDVGVWGGDGGS